MPTIPLRVRSEVTVRYRPATQQQEPITTHHSTVISHVFELMSAAIFSTSSLSVLIYRKRWGQYLLFVKQEALQWRWWDNNNSNGLTRLSRRLAALDRAGTLCSTLSFGSLHHPALCGKKHKDNITFSERNESARTCSHSVQHMSSSIRMSRINVKVVGNALPWMKHVWVTLRVIDKICRFILCK